MNIEDGLQAVIKALDDVVAKAIDGANPLAREQLKLASRYLGFVRQRLPRLAERERAELRHYVALARTLSPWSEACMPPQAKALAECAAGGERALSDPGADRQALQEATVTLKTAISVLVRAAARAAPPKRQAIERAVLHASAQLFDLQRAWYLPMGFEPDPGHVPTLDDALGRSGEAGRDTLP